MDIKTGITFPKPIRRKERHDSHLTAGVPIPTLADEKKFEKRKTKKKIHDLVCVYKKPIIKLVATGRDHGRVNVV